MVRFSGISRLIRKFDELLDLDTKYGGARATIREELRAIDLRLTRLEAREGMVLNEAKAAAAAGASAVMAHSIADVARRIGILEARTASGDPRLGGGPPA